MNTTQPLNLDTAPLTAPVVGRCRGCKSTARTVKGQMIQTRCTCGSAYAWKLLKVTLVDSVKCDVNCMYAKGSTCRCSCGGAEHAAHHQS